MINEDLVTIADWADDWIILLNPSKTSAFLVSRKRELSRNLDIQFKNNTLKDDNTHTHLGLTFSSDGTRGDQINKIYEKASYRFYLMRLLKYDLDRKSLTRFYVAYIRPILEYANIIWDNCTKAQSDRLESVNLDAARIITGLRRGTSQCYTRNLDGVLCLKEEKIANLFNCIKF